MSRVRRYYPLLRRLAFWLPAAAAILVVLATMGEAGTGGREQYVPGIWVDPDGCEHWVMDDGWEGYMTPHVTRDGIPVCNRRKVCGVMSADLLFETDSARIGEAGRARLEAFFRKARATAYMIEGHTDSRASQRHNLELSKLRAQAVARVAHAQGAKIMSIRAFGERYPRASNRSAAGRYRNRRVEIICIP